MTFDMSSTRGTTEISWSSTWSDRLHFKSGMYKAPSSVLRHAPMPRKLSLKCCKFRADTECTKASLSTIDALAMMEPTDLLLMLFQQSSTHFCGHCSLLSTLQHPVHGHDLFAAATLAPLLYQYHSQYTMSH